MAKQVSYNVNNEQTLIATMAHSTSARRRLSKELKSNMFIGKRHRIIFDAMCKMVNNNDEFNEDTLNLYAKGDFGGFKYIRKLLKAYEPNPNIDSHVDILKSDAAKSKLERDWLVRLNDMVIDPDVDLTKILHVVNHIDSDLKKLVSKSRVLSGKQLRKTWLEDFKQRKESGIFVPTYLKALDIHLIEGMARRKVSTIAARPSMGKTTTVSNIALKQSQKKHKVLVCAIEAGSVSMMDAMISNLADIHLSRLIKHCDKLSEQEEKAIRTALKQIVENEHLNFIDDSTLTVDGLGAILDAGNYGICYIDLFERLYDVHIKPEAISEKLKIIQSMAKETNTHICLVNQIKRYNEKMQGGNRRPTLELIKNSGAYEEVSDLVIGLHRDKYYDPELEEDILEIIILKQRRGDKDKIAGYQFVGSHGRLGYGIKEYRPQNRNRPTSDDF